MVARCRAGSIPTAVGDEPRGKSSVGIAPIEVPQGPIDRRHRNRASDDTGRQYTCVERCGFPSLTPDGMTVGCAHSLSSHRPGDAQPRNTDQYAINTSMSPVFFVTATSVAVPLRS